MALNIGNINFGVDATTVGLQKAIRQLEQFQKKTNEVAESQVKGAQQAAAAMARQESAIKRAFQQTVNFQRQLRQSGAPPEDIARVSNAFARLTRELTSGRLSVVEYNRAVDAFQAKMARAKRSLGDFNQEQARGEKGFSRYITLMRDLESSAVLALGPLSGLGARIRSLSAIFARSTLGLALWVSGIAGAIIAIGGLGKAAVTAGQEMKSLSLRFEAATGSAQAGRAELRATIDTARKLGLEVGVLAKSYARFVAASQGTSLEGEKAQKIFNQVARAAAALKLSGAEVEGVMRALEQIMSKGTLQAEELRNQLGDRLPGAYRIAAEAMGVTTMELGRLLKAGDVMAEDFLPKYGDGIEKSLGRNAERNLTTLSGAFNLLKTNTKLLFTDIDEFTHASAAATSIVNALASGVGYLAGEQDFLADKANEANRALRETPTAQKVLKLTQVYTDLSKEVEDAATALRHQQEAIGFVGRAGDDITYLLDFFKALEDTAKANEDELGKLAERLSFLLDANVPVSAEGIAAAFAELAFQTREANDQIERIRNTPQVLKDIGREFDMMRQRIEALREGPEAAETFDNITMAADTFRKSLEDLNISEAERNRLVAEFIALSSEQTALEQANTEELKRRNDALREAERLEQRAVNGIREAQQELERMRGRVKALGRGPDSLELFENVDEPLLRFRQRLEEAGVEQKTLNNLTAEYGMLLREQHSLTDRFARAAQQMAQATVNGLEDIILKGGSVKQMLREVAQELLRVWLRAQVLDAIQAYMGGSGGFGAIFSGAGGGGAAVSGGGSGIGVGGSGTFAKGGTFRLRGSGGSDKVPFFGIGKAGETVTVARPDQVLAGGMGGGASIVIHQTNMFEGTITPETLIPILEENNRKLEGEILDKLDRGSYS